MRGGLWSICQEGEGLWVISTSRKFENKLTKKMRDFLPNKRKFLLKLYIIELLLK